MKKSPTIKLIELVYRKSFAAKQHSWRTDNDCLQTALSLAIRAGMEFYKDDFKYISDNFNFGYWAGSDGHMSGEGFYSKAISENNIKAAQSFEAWKNRKPFIYEGISHAWKKGFIERKRCRIFVDAQFTWNGEQVNVTSFSENGLYFIACSYHPKKDQYDFLKIKKRYKITHADLKKASAENKAIEKIREAVYSPFSRLNTNFYNRIVELFWLSFRKEGTTELDFFRMLAGLPHNANKQ